MFLVLVEKRVRVPANRLDCASLARIRTLGPVKVREFVSFHALKQCTWDHGTKVVPKMFEYARPIRARMTHLIKKRIR